MASNESFIILIISILIFSLCLFTSLAATSSDTLKQGGKVVFSSSESTYLAATSSDTLKQGGKVVFSSSESTYLVSAQKVFTLGFFTPPNSNYSYLGIWYTADLDPYPYPVWVGNRNTPITNNSGVLTIDTAGNLIITHDGGKLIKLYRNQNSTNITATLLDSGNFIVREVKKNNESAILWESFDYPTDMLLPGMKLGINHRTGRKWSLTSWFHEELATTGAFTLDWDPSGHRLVVRRRGVIYWTSGSLGEKNFDFINADNSNFSYKFINVTSMDEEYFTYSVIKYPRPINISGWLLNIQGDIHDAGHSPIAQVSLCYGYNAEGGCELWEQPKCRNNNQTFELKSGSFRDVNKSDAPWFIDKNMSLSISDCRANCWNDCDCIGFIGEPGCAYWRGNSEFHQDTGNFLFVLISKPPTEPPLEPLLESPSEPPNKRSKGWIWILIAVVIAFIMVVFGGLCHLRRRNITLTGEDATRNINYLMELMEPNEYTNTRELENEDNNCSDLKVLSFGDVIAATNSFSPENKLGEGGFGPVYKADPTQKEKLSWQKRFNIIEGIAQGLLYLHKYSRLKIIHRDLKASNILLDENMNPKISDFGMARIFKQNMLEANTNRVVGTYGYMAPEYAIEGTFSVKSDIFSFGVLMLEIVSGRKNNSFNHLEGPHNLMGYAWELWSKDVALELMDPVLRDSCIAQQILRCIHVALLCVQDCASDRPTMSDVVSMLANDNITLPLPKKSAFVFGNFVDEGDSSKSLLEKCSINGLSISALDAR